MQQYRPSLLIGAHTVASVAVGHLSPSLPNAAAHSTCPLELTRIRVTRETLLGLCRAWIIVSGAVFTWWLEHVTTCHHSGGFASHSLLTEKLWNPLIISTLGIEHLNLRLWLSFYLISSTCKMGLFLPLWGWFSLDNWNHNPVVPRKQSLAGAGLWQDEEKELWGRFPSLQFFLCRLFYPNNNLVQKNWIRDPKNVSFSYIHLKDTLIPSAVAKLWLRFHVGEMVHGPHLFWELCKLYV